VPLDPFVGENLRGGPTDTAGGTGYDCDLAFQAPHITISCIPLMRLPSVPVQLRTASVAVTKNLVRIESVDVGPVPLVSSHSYAGSAWFRYCGPLFLLPDSGGLAIGDPRSPPPDQCAAEVAAWACSAELGGPAPLDLAYAALVRLALCARHRETGDGDGLASQGIPAVLDLEERHGQPGRPLLTKESRELIRKMSLAKAPGQFYVTDRILSNHSQKRIRLCIPADSNRCLGPLACRLAGRKNIP
jgi:hypothetical protein